MSIFDREDIELNEYNLHSVFGFIKLLDREYKSPAPEDFEPIFYFRRYINGVEIEIWCPRTKYYGWYSPLYNKILDESLVILCDRRIVLKGVNLSDLCDLSDFLKNKKIGVKKILNLYRKILFNYYE